jgi:hypothetical protein
MSAKTPEAAEALIDVAQSGEVPEVRIEAIRDLARLAADAKEDVRRAAIEAVRTALKPTAGPRAFRVAAAGAAAALADDGALPGVLALAAETAKPGDATLPEDLAPAVEELVSALAKSGAANDAAIVDGLLRLAAAGAYEPAVLLADAAADASEGRLVLQGLRASIRMDRSKLPDRESAARRQDVAEAHRILRSVVVARNGRAPEDARELQAWTATLALLEEASAVLLADPATANGARRAALFAGIEAVVRRERTAGVPRALAWLAQARRLADLAPAEQVQLAGWEAELGRLLRPR